MKFKQPRPNFGPISREKYNRCENALSKRKEHKLWSMFLTPYLAVRYMVKPLHHSDNHIGFELDGYVYFRLITVNGPVYLRAKIENHKGKKFLIHPSLLNGRTISWEHARLDMLGNADVKNWRELYAVTESRQGVGYRFHLGHAAFAKANELKAELYKVVPYPYIVTNGGPTIEQRWQHCKETKMLFPC